MEYEGREVEFVLGKNDWQSHNLKRDAFERRMDRIREAQNHAKDHDEYSRLQTLRDQTIKFYNKYANTNHKN